MGQVLLVVKIPAEDGEGDAGPLCDVLRGGRLVSLLPEQLPGCVHDLLPLGGLVLRALSRAAEEEPVAQRIPLVDDPVVHAGDVGAPGDSRDDALSASHIHLLQDLSGKEGAGDALVDKLPADLHLSLCVQGGKLCRGPGSAGGAVRLGIAEDDAVLHVRAGRFCLPVELHQVHRRDVEVGVADLHGVVDLLPDLHAKVRDLLDVADLQGEADGVRVDEGKEGPAKRDVAGDPAIAWDLDLEVFLIEKGGDVHNARFHGVTVLHLHPGTDDPGGGIQDNCGIGLCDRHHVGLNQHGGCADAAVAAHVQATAAVEKDDAGIGLPVHGLRQHRPEHVPVPAGLEHQRAAQFIVVLHQVLLLVHHGLSGQVRKAVIDDPRRLALGVTVDGL